MAEDKKKVYVTQGGAGEGMGILAAVILIGIGFVIVAASLRDDKAAINVNVDRPKVEAPSSDK